MRIFFDVHGTLLSADETVLRPGTEELLRDLHEEGHELTLWSTGGSGYAWGFAHRYDLLPYLFETLSKSSVVRSPDLCVDDHETHLVGRRGNVRVKTYRGEADDRELERVREAIRRLTLEDRG